MMRKLLLNTFYDKTAQAGFVLVLFVCFATGFHGHSQTTLINPATNGGFESGATFGANGWSNNVPGSATNVQWVCSTGATTGFSGTNAAYVTNNRAATPPPHTYTTTATRTTHFYRDVTVPVGEGLITLNFDWIADGEGTYDYMRVWLVPTTYNPGYNTLIPAGGGRIQVAGNFSEQYTWTNSTFILPAALAGNTFRLVFEWRNDDSVGGIPPAAVDNISLTSAIIVPPSNDNPCTATSLTVNADLLCGTTTSGTVIYATNSGLNACTGTEDDDVWYSFVATGPIHSVDLLNIAGSSTNMNHAVYGDYIAPDCTVAVGDVILCSDPNSSIITGLITGRTYFVQVYTSTATTGQTTTFDICIGTPPPPPANDEPCGAIPLSVNFPCSYSTHTTENATGTLGVTAPGCASYNGGDVWFQTTIPAGGSIVINTEAIDFTDSGMATYSGATCGALTLISCDDDGGTGAMSSITLTGRTPGETIYIRFWEYGNNASGEFEICVTEPPPPPPNDEPCDAIGLTSDVACNVTSGYIEQATNSGIDSCFGTPNDDVWYSFVATDTTHYIDLTNVAGSPTDLYHAVYGGFTAPDCSVTTGDNISCSDANSSTVTGLSIGDTYFIQVFSYSSSSGATTSFDICVTEPPPPCVIGLTPITTPSCPYVDVTPDTSTVFGSCGGPGSGSETLTVDYLDLGDTSDYDVDLIPYNATTFATLSAAATSIVALSADDRWSDLSYTMPIDFCFYGNTITNFVVGANGIISFDSGLANSASGYTFDENLPSVDESLVENAIYAVYHDIDPGVSGTGDITYGTTSIGGCNVLVVLWDNIPMYYNGNSGDNSKRHTAMAVLYEGTNIIEVLIEEKVIDDVFITDIWNDGNAIVGVQNPGATEAVVAPCRNGLDQNWATTNEAWRFTPSGTSVTTLEWLVNGVLNPTYDGQTSITVSPATTTTYTARITYILCDRSSIIITDATTVVVGGGKVWDGSESSDWMDPDNWSDGAVPTAADCVIIPVTANDPILYDNANGDGLFMTIETGATLTLTSDTDNNGFASSLTIQDNIDIQGTGSLIIENDASLIQVYDSSTLATLPSGPNTGDIVLYRDTSIRRLDYVYWSSPVQGFDVSDVYGAFTPTSRIYNWTPTIPTGTFNTGVPVCYGNWNPLSSGTMDLGKGYIVRGPTNHSVGISTATSVFTGVPNNGVITQPISSGNNSFGNSNYTYNPYGTDILTVTPFDDNWNLLGNPYPSALDAHSFITHPNNSIIEGAVHVWTHGIPIGANGDSFYDDFEFTYSVNDYITYNFSGTNTYAYETFGGKIGSGQGFFVLALSDSESGSVTFDNSMRDRTHRNTDFYRTANPNEDPSDVNAIERNRIWLNLLGPNGSTSSILVGYIEGATQEKDRLFDAYTREVNELSMYSKIGNERMIIQGRALPFDNNDQVPIGTVIPEPGQYTIAISNVDGLFLDDNQAIYLEDSYAGIIHNLRAAPYTFTETVSIDYENRFILRYTDDALSITDYELSALSIIAPNGKYIKVKSEQSLIETVIVYDLLGRILFDMKSIKETELVLNNHNLSDGTYIVKATLTNGRSKAQKIVLKD